MFGLFRKRLKPTLDDPVFGRIALDLTRGINMWTHLPLDAESPMLCIEAPPSGPSEAQREFYYALRRELPSRASECKDFISRCETKPSNLDAMTVYAVNVGPDGEIRNGRFEIELSDADAHEIHRVVFENMKPIGYEVDD